MIGDIFHILNRGVEKRKIFLDKEDYLRFTYNLLDFNSKELINISYYNRRRSAMRSPKMPKMLKTELVDIFCWCFMPNHMHILVQEKIDGGVSKFSKKLTGGYTSYFNLKNNRSGVLFQGRSKIILLKHDVHFLWIPFYIIANPLDLFQADWREKGIKNPKKAFEFLEHYQWSCFLDLIRKGNLPEIINKTLFYKTYGTNENKFKNDFIEWLRGYKKAIFGDAIAEYDKKEIE